MERELHTVCWSIYKLTIHQWQLVEKLIKILKPFKEAKVAVSSEGLLAALVIPVMNLLAYFLENRSTKEDEGVWTMKRKMLL